MNANTQKPYFKYRVQWIDEDGWSRGYRRFNVLESAIAAAKECFKRIPLVNARIPRSKNHWSMTAVEQWVGPHVYKYHTIYFVDKNGAREVGGAS